MVKETIKERQAQMVVRSRRGKQIALWKQIEAMQPKERFEVLEAVWTLDGSLYLEHTLFYISVRGSFYRSREWKTFRAFFLQCFPICSRCGKPADQVHHLETIDTTVIEKGFLALFGDYRLFSSLCQDCHYEEHLGTIAYEEEIIKIGGSKASGG